jgi:predicted oxidoreductase
MDFFLRKKIKPMAWSPLAKGRILNPNGENGKRILHVLNEVAEELGVSPVEKIVYAWLLRHPAKIIPVAGSGRIERIRYAVDALDIDMSLEQWYKIFIAARGNELP